MVKSTDGVLKKETHCATDKRDENDENGVVVELNNDQNEMTQNLNSVLSYNLLKRSMTKIMDDIIADGSKDEAEKNENKTDNTTERPMYDKIS